MAAETEGLTAIVLCNVAPRSTGGNAFSRIAPMIAIDANTEIAYNRSNVYGSRRPVVRYRLTTEMTMSNSISPKLPGRVRGRPFEKGRSGNPAGRRVGSRNKTTLAAAALLAGESEALTRKAVEMALAGDPTAMRLCIERVLPPCRERAIKFSLPPIEGVSTGETRGPSCHDVSLAMNAVTSALARGEITPGEAETIAGVVDTFVRAIETTRKGGSRLNLMEILTARDCDWDEDDSEDDDDGETGDYEEPDDCDYHETDPK